MPYLQDRGILDFNDIAPEFEEESEYWEQSDEDRDQEEDEEKCMDDAVRDEDADVDDGYGRKPNDTLPTLVDTQPPPMINVAAAVLKTASVANAQPQSQPQESVLCPFQVASVAHTQPQPQESVLSPFQVASVAKDEEICMAEDNEEKKDDAVRDEDAEVDDGYGRKPNDIRLTLGEAQPLPISMALYKEAEVDALPQHKSMDSASALPRVEVTSVADALRRSLQERPQQQRRRQKKVLLASAQQWLTLIRKGKAIQPRKLTTSSSSKSCSIHRVPYCIRRHNMNAYDPQVVSIGPFHYKKRQGRLKPMEEHKWRYLNDFRNKRGEHRLKHCWEALKKLEKEARRCYSEEVDRLDNNSFVEMMLLDGCFIIEFFRRPTNPTEYHDDPIVKLGWLNRAIAVDLLLLENQIPFFILEKLCKELGIRNGFLNKWVSSSFSPPVNSSNPTKSNDHTIVILDKENAPKSQVPCPADPPKSVDAASFNQKEEKQNAPEFRHLLHFVHHLHFPNSTQKEEKRPITAWARWIKPVFYTFGSEDRDMPPPTQREEKEHALNQARPAKMIIPSAARLHEAGIKFEKGDGLSDIAFEKEVSKIPLLKVFEKGVIKIPLLKVKDSPTSVLLNLVAFEQCYRYCKSHYSGYICFMDCLIDNAKDVEILCEKGIIYRWLSSDQEVAALFNKMGREIILYDCDPNLTEVCNEVNEYYKASCHTWGTILKRYYLRNPWTIISVGAATVLLLLTIAQTFFTVVPKFTVGN